MTTESVLQSPSSPIPSPPPDNERTDYDIFLSFRGPDTRDIFTSYLCWELRKMHLKTFIDNEDLKKGEKIEELLGYIERSKVFVPIISKGYADSKWCLKEIAKIVECADGRLILPIFFDVEPSHVRHQTGHFGPAFQSYVNDKNKDNAEVEKWRRALEKVSKLFGYSLQNNADGKPPKLLEIVVGHLVRHLDSGFLYVADHPIGMESRVEDVKKLLRIGGDGITKVGIVGTGGIGKTTIAKAVFNKLRLDFGASTFLANIRESWKAPASQTQLMRQYCEEILNDKFTTINNADVGRRLLSERVPSKKVLIVLDDVDSHANQFSELKSLSFAPGSRIIITTRDESVALGYGVNKENVYKPKLLETDQSLDLFNRYAFQNTQEPQDIYLHMSEKVAAIAGGLPLALKVFGSYLSDKGDLEEWQEYVEKLQSNSDTEIQKRLQISYDGLSTEAVKRIFLDIACFYIGNFRREATFMWENLNLQPRSAVRELQRKSLITVGGDGEFQMHDLLRDMARDIVRQPEYSKPWTWTRLWNNHEIMEVLGKKNIGTKDVIESISLSGNGKPLRTDDFGEMTSLNVLRVTDVSFEGENFLLPVGLKILHLCRGKFKSLSSCNLENLVALQLEEADGVSEVLVKESAGMHFNALKVLKINCHTIKSTPDFSNMPHLEVLVFFYCASLSEVHESIGNLTKLKYLKFLQCLNLEKLPDAICKLTSLQTLILNQFPRLLSLPRRLGELQSLEELGLEDLAITDIPYSIGQLEKLHKLYLKKLDRLRSLPDSISALNCLERFDIEGTNLKGIKIDGVDFMNMNRLEISICSCFTVLPTSSLTKARALYVTDGTVEELPESISSMENITKFSLRCKNLKALPDWLPHWKNLKTFEVGCECLTLKMINIIWSLTCVESLSLHCATLNELPPVAGSFAENLKSFTLGCKNLKELPEWIGSLTSLGYLKFEACENVTHLPLCISNLSQLEELALNGCKRIRSVPRLPSSLLVFDASDCSDLENTLDVSNLKSLKKLCLGGCRLLVDVEGIENAAQTMEELVLPGPYGSIGCSCLSQDFKN